MQSNHCYCGYLKEIVIKYNSKKSQKSYYLSAEDGRKYLSNLFTQVMSERQWHKIDENEMKEEISKRFLPF